LEKCEISIIEDISPPQKIKTTQYNRWEVKCRDCGHQFISKACKNDYEDKIQKIRSAKWRYIDETGIKINGENWWLWIFRTDTNETLVVIRKSRGSKVLEEILGEGHKGANIADGWRAYSWIDKLQRCWAHLLREVDHFIDTSENGKRLSEDIHACFKKLRDFLDRDPSIEERRENKAVFEKELEDIVTINTLNSKS
jgi:transposase